MDPVSVSVTALSIASICYKAVKKLKTFIEAMKSTNKGLLDLLEAAERTRLYLENLRSLAVQLDGKVRHTLNFNEYNCMKTVGDLQTLVDNIIQGSRQSKFLLRLSWVLYKADSESLVKRLLEQEAQISVTLALVNAQSNVTIQKNLELLKEEIKSQSQVIDPFDTVRLVDDGDEHLENTLAKSDSMPIWHGYPLSDRFSKEYVEERNSLADNAKYARWDRLWEGLQRGNENHRENWINCFRLSIQLFYGLKGNMCIDYATEPIEEKDRISLWTPLHQAAFMCASTEVVETMLTQGALRTLRTRWSDENFDHKNLTAIEIARDLGYSHLFEILSPVIHYPLPDTVIIALQRIFHDMIHEDLRDRGDLSFMNLPDLAALTELESPEMWFPIPFLGDDCGYSYRLDGRELVVQSRYTNTSKGVKLYRITTEEVFEIEQAIIFNNA